MRVDLINIINKKMKEKDISVKDLAKMTGISTSYMYQLLKLERRWNEETIEIVTKELGIEITFQERR